MNTASRIEYEIAKDLTVHFGTAQVGKKVLVPVRQKWGFWPEMIDLPTKVIVIPRPCATEVRRPSRSLSLVSADGWNVVPVTPGMTWTEDRLVDRGMNPDHIDKARRPPKSHPGRSAFNVDYLPETWLDDSYCGCPEIEDRSARIEQCFKPAAKSNTHTLTNVASVDGDSTYADEIKTLREDVKAAIVTAQGLDRKIIRRGADYDCNRGGHDYRHWNMTPTDGPYERAERRHNGWLHLRNCSQEQKPARNEAYRTAMYEAKYRKGTYEAKYRKGVK